MNTTIDPATGRIDTKTADAAQHRFALLVELVALGDGPDDPPTILDVENDGAFSFTAYRDEFGTWPTALRAAGFTRTDTGGNR